LNVAVTYDRCFNVARDLPIERPDLLAADSVVHASWPVDVIRNAIRAIAATTWIEES